MKNLTITVIGGGSVNWMKTLMQDVYLLDEVGGGQIRLVDPNTEHVKAVADMLRAFNRMRGKDYEIIVADDRRAALTGADFVMTTFSPGAMDAFWNDLEIPVKYGIRQPVSMTVGPCGISAALRVVPVVTEIVEEMEQVCPDAWLLNVTNPMSVVTRAMNLAARRVKVVGMCHEFHAMASLIGPMLGLPPRNGAGCLDYLYRILPEMGLDYTVAGLNHFIWLTEVSLRGEDMLPRIREYCRDHWEFPPQDGKEIKPYTNRHAVKFALCRQFGALPLPGDRHLVEFWPSLCNVRNGYGMKYNVMKTTVDKRRLLKVGQLEEIRAIAAGKLEVKWEKTAEEMVDIMAAIVGGRSTPCIVNMPNRGQIANLPMDIAVETLATISPDGIVPKPSGRLPGAVASLCRLHADVHELTVQAALSGDRAQLVEALGLDPLSGGADFTEIPALAEELLNANREWLPRFF